MIEVENGRFPTFVPYRITDDGVVDLNLPPSWFGKMPIHEPDVLWPKGEFHFPSGGWEILDWPDERHFRLRYAGSDINTEYDGRVTFQINRRNRVTLAKLEDLLAGKPLAGNPQPSAAKALSMQSLSVNLQLPEKATVGDPVQAKFVITNNGSKSVDISAADRTFAVALTIQIKDGKGNILRDFVDDGVSLKDGLTTVKPRESVTLEFPLESCAPIIEAGIHTFTAKIRQTPLLDRTHPQPVATATIEFQMPTPERAAERIHELCQKTDRATIWELQHLWAPVFLPALRAEAKAGRRPACLGLGSIIAQEANEELLELATSNDAVIAKAAARVLLGRLPSLAHPKEPAFDSHQGIFSPPQILELWRPEQDAPLMAAARRLLAVNPAEKEPAAEQDLAWVQSVLAIDANAVSLGALLIQQRGSVEQAGTLLEAMERALSAPMPPRNGRDSSDFAGISQSLDELLRTVDVLRHRGWRTDGTGSTAAQLAFLRQLADPSIPKPKDPAWRAVVRKSIAHPHSILRKNAILAVPLPFPRDWEPNLVGAFHDPDWDVVELACELAGKTKVRNLVHPLAEVVKTIPAEGVRLAATEAAKKLGAGTEFWQAWCEIMLEQKVNMDAVVQLILGTIDLPRSHGSSSSGQYDEQLSIIHEAWRTFLARNRDRLDHGHRVPRNDPSITPALTDSRYPNSPAVEIDLDDGTRFPLPK